MKPYSADMSVRQDFYERKSRHDSIVLGLPERAS